MSEHPYSKLMNSIPFFGNKKPEVEEEVVTTIDTEKALKMSDIELTHCPYKKKTEEKKTESQEKERSEKQKCPFSSKADVTKDDSDVEDNIPKGGCPVMNTSKNNICFYKNLKKINFVKFLIFYFISSKIELSLNLEIEIDR